MLKYEDNLWGKVDFLHNRYHKIYSNLKHFVEMITKFQTAFHNFSKSLEFISNQSYKIYSDKKLSLYPVIGSIPKNIILHSKEFAEFSEFIRSKIIKQGSESLNEAYTKENNCYQNYIRAKRNYNNNKIDLERSKTNFNNNAKICENLIINAKSMKYNSLATQKEIERNENRANEGLSDAKVYENRYIEYLNETNRNREEINKKELELLKMYQDMDAELVIKIKGMLCMYIAGIKKMYTTILKDINWIHNQFKKIDSENDTKIFINEYKSDLQKEEKIPFIPYEPKSTLNPNLIKPSGDSQKDEAMLDINYEVICSLKNNLKNVCSSINLEEEAKRKRLRYLTAKVFKINVDFLEEEKKELLEYVKEISYRQYFMIMLSKQRTRGRYKRSKKLIQDLSEILNCIIVDCEKQNDYEGAKNCIILSQTYYCELTKKDNTKYKYYLFNNIKNNKWMHTLEFWENLIETMIQKDIKSNEENNSNIIMTEKRKKSAISNVCFSQLLPYSQNMFEIGISKEDILSICKKFIDKYRLKKEFADTIINNLNNLKKEEEIKIEDLKEEEEKKNPKNNIMKKKSLPTEGNVKVIIDDFLRNSMIAQTKINLRDSGNKNINKNNIINEDPNSDKINIINEETNPSNINNINDDSNSNTINIFNKDTNPNKINIINGDSIPKKNNFNIDDSNPKIINDIYEDNSPIKINSKDEDSNSNKINNIKEDTNLKTFSDINDDPNPIKINNIIEDLNHNENNTNNEDINLNKINTINEETETNKKNINSEDSNPNKNNIINEDNTEDKKDINPTNGKEMEKNINDQNKEEDSKPESL